MESKKSQTLIFYIVVLWVGSLWSLGAFYAPALFSSLSDRALAGVVAGHLFRMQAWISIVCGFLAYGWYWFWGQEQSQSRKVVLGLITKMLVCTLIYFATQPEMSMLRELMHQHETKDILYFGYKPGVWFMLLHFVLSIFYVIQAVLGALLLKKIP